MATVKETNPLLLASLLLLASAVHVTDAGLRSAASCEGRRIYVHKLPPKFNKLLMLQNEDYEPANKKWFTEQMLRVLERVASKSGFGSSMRSPVKPDLPGAWFRTDQFALEVIFHSRMAHYPCRTGDYQEADLIYVPYYGGLDMTRHMHEDNSVKERLAKELAGWLQRHPAWEKNQGKDHFWVLGRETWDFRKNPDGIWGNNLLNLPGINETVITVDGETTPWLKNDFCAPKPTGFHPATQAELDEWVQSVKQQERPFLFSFVAGRRKNTTFEGAIREKLFWQCEQSSDCYLGDCDANQKLVGEKWVAGCESPRYVMRVYLKSTFCLHPRGDSCNRRSVLDSMLAGCIPVVFEDCTLSHQYGWHVRSGIHMLDDKKFFIQLPYDRLRGPHDGERFADGRLLVMVQEELRKIPAAKIKAMRQKVIDLIPRITYGGKPVEEDGSILPPDFEDAFDIIIDGLVQVRERNSADY